MTEEQQKEFGIIFKSLSEESLIWLKQKAEKEIQERNEVFEQLKEMMEGS